MTTMTNALALSWAFLAAIAPLTLANDPPPESTGWTPWRPFIQGETQPYSAGFSNMELGGHMDFEYSCTTQAETEKTKPDYFYRLNDLVETMGTGTVEYKCTIHDQLFLTHTSQAVKADLTYPVCLEVNTDVGDGVRIRADKSLDAAIVASLSNGTQFYEATAPALISADQTGRQWLYLQQEDYQGWASIAAQAGAHINFKLCP